MHTAGQLVRQSRIDHPLPRDTRLPFESARDNHQAKMRLAARMGMTLHTGMSSMTSRLINDLKMQRVQCSFEFGFDIGGDGHDDSLSVRYDGSSHGQAACSFGSARKVVCVPVSVKNPHP